MGEPALVIAVLLTLGAGAAFWLSARRAVAASGGDPRTLAARPVHYGWRGGLAFAAGAAGMLAVAAIVQALAPGALQSGWTGGLAAVLAGSALAGWALATTRRDLNARNFLERVARWLLAAAALVAILTTAGILLSLFGETVRFFREVHAYGGVTPWDFVFGTKWSAQISLVEGGSGASGAFGAAPLFLGTLVITLIALLVAGPIGLFAAIFLSEYASPRVRRYVKPTLELLAGVPSIVYGVFALTTVGPMISGGLAAIGIEAEARSALTAGVVMGIMIIPFISSFSETVIHAIPQNLRDGSLAMGATPSETVRRVVLPAALPGVVAAFLLGFSRAVGETMIVAMAAGQSAPFSINPLESLTTVTVHIVSLLTGDVAFDSPKTLAAFALGLVLFLVTLGFNLIANWVVERFRERYE